MNDARYERHADDIFWHLRHLHASITLIEYERYRPPSQIHPSKFRIRLVGTETQFKGM
jgi:hypothetical protein